MECTNAGHAIDVNDVDESFLLDNEERRRMIIQSAAIQYGIENFSTLVKNNSPTLFAQIEIAQGRHGIIKKMMAACTTFRQALKTYGKELSDLEEGLWLKDFEMAKKMTSIFKFVHTKFEPDVDLGKHIYV